MSDGLQAHIDDVLADAPGAQRFLVEYLGAAPAEDWLVAARHESPVVRRCAARSSVGRKIDEPEALGALLLLTGDADVSVRLALASALSGTTGWSPRAVVLDDLLADADPDVRLRAAEAARHAPDVVARLIRLVRNDPSDAVRGAAAASLLDAVRPADLSLLLGLVADLDASDGGQSHMWDVLRAVDRCIAIAPDGSLEGPRDRRLLDILDQAHRQHVAPPGMMSYLSAYLEKVGYGKRPPAPPAQERRPTQPSPVTIAEPEYGVDLTAGVAQGALAILHRDELVDRVLSVVTSSAEGSRSVALVGDSGVGKTAVVHELARRLADRDMRVIEVSGYDFMTGTRYLGEWETRVERILSYVRQKRAFAFIPGFDQLITTGRSSDSERNVADMLAPRIERGEVVIIGESTVDAYERSIGQLPHLDRLFTRIDVPPLGTEETADIVRYAAGDLGVELSDQVLGRLLELADDYLVRYENPDRALRLLKGAVSLAPESVDEQALLGYLHESTGVPVDLLDESRALDVKAIRNQLQARVMGQPEAIDAMVEVITLIKAGLTDPGRPNGVFMFVGPTGVGKTELARSLGEFLFGDADRLVRFDMSEYATFEAFERLIGAGRAATADLTDAVRTQPFSVILMDEIEKAHPNVYDLCLQLFDAGRLTDGRGRTADFRNAIVIMTSNVGAAVSGSGIGFVSKTEAPDEAAMQRALEKYFRPEFLNRIDRIVPFRPLDIEIAERITRKEIRQGLDRKGLRRRDISVDIDPSLIALLLKEGYSQEYGARPLRRAVERLVLTPVANEIAAGRAAHNAVLRLTADGDRLAIRRIHAGRETVEAEPGTSELEPLIARYEVIEEQAVGLQSEKLELLERSALPEFWDDQSQALSVLDRIHRLDRVLSDVRRLGRDIERTERNPDPTRRASYVASHHRESRRLEFLFAAGNLSDAFLVLTSIRRRGEPIDGVELLIGMYRGLGRQRHLEVVPIDDRITTSDRTATLMLGGAGAYALLRSEAGLHRFTRRRDAGERQDADLVRVDVMAVPPVAGFRDGEVRFDVSQVVDVDWRVDEGGAGTEVHALHEPSLHSVTLRSSVHKDEAIDRALLLLKARLDHKPGDVSDETIRRYSFGSDSLVKDLRTGRSTGRVRDVLTGDIDEFLMVGS